MESEFRDRYRRCFAASPSPRTFKYQDDYYGVNAANQLGLTDSRSWSGGVDVTYMINPDTSVMVGYMREYYDAARV